MLSRLNSRLCFYSLLKKTTNNGQKQTNLLARCLSDRFSEFPKEDLLDEDDEFNPGFSRGGRNASKPGFGERNEFNRGFSSGGGNDYPDEGNEFNHGFSRGGGNDFNRGFSRGGRNDFNRGFSRGGAKDYLGGVGREGGNDFNRGFSDKDSDDWVFKKQKVEASGIIQKNNYQEHPEVQNASRDEANEFFNKHQITFSKGSQDIPKPVLKFEHANFSDPCMKIIQRQGWQEPSPIQSVTWPIVLSGSDLIGIAQTGSGKTLGFVHPAIVHCQNRKANKSMGPVGMVLVPTRELAQQVTKVANQFMRPCGLKCAAVFGGASKNYQLERIGGVDMIVATPGRLNDFLSMGAISLVNCSYLVLDEADRMLDMGFEIQIRNIIESMRDDRQTLMWSATWPYEIQNLGRDFLSNPVHISVGSTDLKANPGVTQTFKVVDMHEKLNVFLPDIMKELNNKGKVLVFTNSKAQADVLTLKSRQKRIPAASIHGDKSQQERDRMLNDFRNGIFNCLIATDVAARGLDINDITLVLNYDCPNDFESYIHRIGRTARAGKTGSSLTYLSHGNREDNATAPKILEALQRDGKYDDELADFAQSSRLSRGRGPRDMSFRRNSYSRSNYN